MGFANFRLLIFFNKRNYRKMRSLFYKGIEKNLVTLDIFYKGIIRKCDIFYKGIVKNDHFMVIFLSFLCKEKTRKNFLLNFQTLDIVLFSRLQNSKKQRSFAYGGDEFGYNSWNTFVLWNEPPRKVKTGPRLVQEGMVCNNLLLLSCVILFYLFFKLHSTYMYSMNSLLTQICTE